MAPCSHMSCGVSLQCRCQGPKSWGCRLPTRPHGPKCMIVCFPYPLVLRHIKLLSAGTWTPMSLGEKLKSTTLINFIIFLSWHQSAKCKALPTHKTPWTKMHDCMLPNTPRAGAYQAFIRRQLCTTCTWRSASSTPHFFLYFIIIF